MKTNEPEPISSRQQPHAASDGTSPPTTPEPTTAANAAEPPRRGRRGAIYARYSTKFQHSTEDQIRECRRWADDHGIQVGERHIYKDEAVTGKSSRRKGLNALQAALEADEIDVVIVFATNRLYRKMHKSLAFVDEEIVERRKRCVFTSSAIDTADNEQWLQRLQLFTMLDEFVGQANVKHIQAAHRGQLGKGLVFGSMPFGYTGEAVEGQITKRGQPTRRIALDPETAVWVRRLFAWYVDQGMSISAIVRRLNTDGVPLSPHAQGGRWTYPTVRHLLSNSRYTGRWSYGTSENRWLNRKGYSRQVHRDEPLSTVQFEGLRIIDEVTWQKAQVRLANNRRAGGRTAKSGQHGEHPRLLNGLIYCAVHGRRLTTSGTRGIYVSCPTCKAEMNPALYTMLNRQLATDLIATKISEMLVSDVELIDNAIDICRACVEAADRPNPTEIEDLHRRERRLSQQIRYVLNMPAETDEDTTENRTKMQALRAERATVKQSIVELEEALRRPTVVPDPDDLRERFTHFAEVLRRAAKSGEPGPLHAAREFLTKITGGRIELTQCGERKAQRGWLRATVHLDLLKPVLDEFGRRCKPSPQRLVTIDIRKPTRAERLASEVKVLYDQGLKQNEIARRLKINRNTVRKALDAAFKAECAARPDGRARRWCVSEDQQPQYKFRVIADAVMKLYNQGLSIKDIATRVEADRNTVTEVIRHWHEQCGLTAPDGRARRKQLRQERERSSCEGDDRHQRGSETAAGA